MNWIENERWINLAIWACILGMFLRALTLDAWDTKRVLEYGLLLILWAVSAHCRKVRAKANKVLLLAALQRRS